MFISDGGEVRAACVVLHLELVEPRRRYGVQREKVLAAPAHAKTLARPFALSFLRRLSLWHIHHARISVRTHTQRSRGAFSCSPPHTAESAGANLCV